MFSCGIFVSVTGGFKDHLHILLYDAVAVSQRFLYTADSCSKSWNSVWSCASVRHLELFGMYSGVSKALALGGVPSF